MKCWIFQDRLLINLADLSCPIWSSSRKYKTKISPWESRTVSCFLCWGALQRPIKYKYEVMLKKIKTKSGSNVYHKDFLESESDCHLWKRDTASRQLAFHPMQLLQQKRPECRSWGSVTILEVSQPGILPSLSSVPFQSVQRLFLFLYQENWRLLRIKK